MVKNPAANAGDIRDVGLILGLGRSPGEGYDNPLQEPGRLQSIWSQKVHMTEANLACMR